MANTPLSRRTVLSATAGQALRHMVPGLDALAPGVSDAAKVADIVPEVAKAVAPAMPMTIQGVIARAAKMGLDEDETIQVLEKMGVANESDVMYMMPTVRNPYDFIDTLGEADRMTPASAMSHLLNEDIGSPLMSMRRPLREIRRENPELYNDLKGAAREIADYSSEYFE